MQALSYFTIAWIGWFVYFFAVEVPALLNDRKGDTLSEHIWNWFAIRRKGRAWRARRFVLGAFLLWLSIHFMTGGLV